jgi:hypothetical protein
MRNRNHGALAHLLPQDPLNAQRGLEIDGCGGLI